MRTIARFGLVPAVALAMACAGGDGTSAEEMNAELQRDLALASGVGLDLAQAQNGDLQVVSAIESPDAGSITRAPAPRRTPKAPPAPVVEPLVSDEVTEDPVPALVEEPVVATATGGEESTAPVISSRPTPVAVSFPTVGDGGYGGGSGGGGVVIRGGGTGIDHCERHPRRGRGRPGTMVGFPGIPRAGGLPPRAPIPMTGPTFPR